MKEPYFPARNSDEFQELVKAVAGEHRDAIQAQREYRKQMRLKQIRVRKPPERKGTYYEPLYRWDTWALPPFLPPSQPSATVVSRDVMFMVAPVNPATDPPYTKYFLVQVKGEDTCTE